MTQPTDARILTHFATLEDPRDERGKDHLLIDIITIAICAVICGAESWVDIELYGQSKQTWFSTFLKLPHGIPSHDTLARVFARLDPEAMQQCFLSWITAISALSAGEVIAIDGKKVRHSYDRANGKGAIHMVSAWASANRLVLEQKKVDDKSNEITTIPLLLQVLAIEGCIVTRDGGRNYSPATLSRLTRWGRRKTLLQQLLTKGQTISSHSKAIKAACLKMCNGCLSKLKQPTFRMWCMTLLKR